jgi:hypothetical protein
VSTINPTAPAASPAPVAAPAGYRKGSLLADWLSSTDHKIIGHLYLITSFFFFMVAGLMALIMRAQLLGPDNHLVSDQQYNQLFTMHGTIMLLLFATPLFVGFANEVMPLQIGAPDVAFPRLNILSYYMFAFGGMILLLSFITPGGAAAFGWYAYSPLTSSLYSPGIGGDMWIMGLTLSGLGTILSGVNFVTTIICMRAPGMTMFRMPIFTWNILVTALMVVIVFPLLAATLLAAMADRMLGAHVFDPATGGPMLWQHLFWFAPSMSAPTIPAPSGPAPSRPAGSGDDAEFSALLQRAAAVPMPSPAKAQQTASIVMANPAAVLAAASGRRWLKPATVLLALGAILGATPAIGWLWGVVGCAVVLLGVKAAPPPKPRRPWIAAYRNAKRDANKAEAVLRKANAFPRSNAARAAVEKARNQWTDIGRWKNAKTQQVHAQQANEQRARHLGSHQITPGQIPGIGPGRVDLLAARGIRTAADIAPARIAAIPGFGPALTGELTGWRSYVESRFAYDANAPASTAAVAGVSAEAESKKQKATAGLRHAVADLEATRSRTRPMGRQRHATCPDCYPYGHRRRPTSARRPGRNANNSKERATVLGIIVSLVYALVTITVMLLRFAFKLAYLLISILLRAFR